LIQKYEDLRETINKKNNVVKVKALLGKTVEFLRKAGKIKKNKENIDLDQLRRCKELLEDKDLEDIDSVRREGVWLTSLYKKKILEYRKGLEQALESKSKTSVLL
jgi:hypothetical protein